MMFRCGLLCLMLAGYAFGQGTTPAPETSAPSMSAEPQAKSAQAANVSADAPVITLDGVCDNPPADKTASSNCKTVVTKAQFEELVATLAPNLPPTARRQLATRYAMGLAMAQQAHTMGVDKGPRFEEMLKLARMQVAAQQLSQALQERASQISDKDIEDYYKANPEAYQEVTVERLYLPLSKQMEPSKTKLSDAELKRRKETGDAALKAESETLRKRAAAGEDFTKLQAEGYQAAGYKTPPPSAQPQKIRRTGLPADQLFIMELKSGDVTPVITDASGYTIYKVKDKSIVPLEQAKEEIRSTLKSQRLQQSMQAVQQASTPVLNDDYFGPAPASGAQGRPSLQQAPPPTRQTLPPPK